ncbi:putative acyl-CoA dehydrogenase [Allocatelliglobosispora scoriae]|uniref:Putative acyl-CoA dehydrogenase n=1 Tax=Allocatelliglobosispora scoriae TaxID=643052 RepID=A0A841BXA7_9ACTN|nr:acyl-CoA dehydrogenase family protein [Allocatelliglobosispora scoriae]MBB5873777.1 putative acyl-CoA dehydrogenase [Allocatelliglobosispora scoriae]
MATHDVTNQAPPLVGGNLFTANTPLTEALAWGGAGWAVDHVTAVGAEMGTADAALRADQAHRYPPVLRTHDRFGHRVDEVEFHPAWHSFLGAAVGHGAHGSPWRDPKPGAHVARAAVVMLMHQVEPGHSCPISMTYAAVPALRADPELAAVWEPLITSTVYDPGLRPPQEKAGVLVGMAMTEKQGGSDVRANSTRAVPVGGGEFELTGHKWFCSAPMSDAFLVLAQAPGGLSCFLLPRVLPDGTRNGLRLQRLKDKLGNRSNASAEVEFEAARAHLVGPEGRGVPTIIEMVNHTRLDCVLATTAGMRQSTAEAIWHAGHRSAFGARLVDQPLMRAVLADLALEAEAALVTAVRLASAYDADTPEEKALRRLATAVAKYWICKRGPGHAAEALECLGGNGYVEEAPLARRYREQPLLSIWEGSGNVICLDVLRAMESSPAAVDAFLAELALTGGADRRLDELVARLRRRIGGGRVEQAEARGLVAEMALALQASLLLRYAPGPVSDAFCAARLGSDRGLAYGELPRGLDLGGIIDRHAPTAGS